MNANFFEALFGLMEMAWLMVMAVIVLLTLPVWLLPYTAFKVWKSFRGETWP